MPHLNLLRDPIPLYLVMGVNMPPEGSPRRWGFSVEMADADGRGMGSGAWSIPSAFEHADLGHVLRETYDAWFNGAAHGVLPAAERALRRYQH